MANTYQLGTLVQLAVAFTDLNGNPINPTTVVIYVQDPTQTPEDSTQYTGGQLGNPTVGTFTVAQLLNISGWWTYNGEGTGNIEVSSGDTRIYVEPSAVIPG